MAGCQLVAVKNEDGEWEPYDDSEAAQHLFALGDNNLDKHQVPIEHLLRMTQSWERMYAYSMSNPRPFQEPLRVHIKTGCQNIQIMNEEAWRSALESKSANARAPSNPPASSTGTIRCMALAKKEAFRILDHQVTLLLRTQKTSPGTIHIGIFECSALLLLAKVELSSCREVKSLTALRKITAEGYEHHLDEQSKTFQPLRVNEKGKQHGRLYGWTIDSVELIHPPLRWACVP